MYDYDNVEKYYHIDYSELFKSYTDAQSGKGEDKLIEFFYKIATNVLNLGTPALNFFSSQEVEYSSLASLKDSEVKKDAIQCGVLACYQSYVKDEIKDKEYAMHAFFKTVVEREIYKILNKNIPPFKLYSIDFVPPSLLCYEDSSEEGEEFIESYRGILVNLFNYCKRQIRFSGNKKLLCEIYLWHIIFDQSLRSRYIRRKIVVLGLREEAKFLEQYSKVLYRMCIKKLRSNKKLLKEVKIE
jgi:hypothetical protein